MKMAELHTDMSIGSERHEHSENFAETVSDSLEDLVNTFDEKIMTSVTDSIEYTL